MTLALMLDKNETVNLPLSSDCRTHVLLHKASQSPRRYLVVGLYQQRFNEGGPGGARDTILTRRTLPENVGHSQKCDDSCSDFDKNV